MRRTFLRSTIYLFIGAALLAAAGSFDADRATQAWAASPAKALFSNAYVAPEGPNGVGAQLYLCPRPVPVMVGHTYITYQALMPEEFLYPHYRVYQTPHNDGTVTRTTVRWR
jgi:hypothetical protein